MVASFGLQAAADLGFRSLMLASINEHCPPTEKLLFVCSRNKLRSLTAEKLFEGFPMYQVRSAGTQPDARIVITEGHIGWADLIFVMEKCHLQRIRRKFPEALPGKRVVTLHIRDDYGFMQPELVEELRAKLSPYVTLPGE
ncbi:MAG: protein tyrosine phosphatase [Spartobacteria bacterium]|nr:protein tyrosine phosphatase [Spartobacteria bacterium]